MDCIGRCIDLPCPFVRRDTRRPQYIGMQMLRFALALLGATVALMPGGAYGQYEFEVSSVTDSCDCIKIVATSLYRAGETLDNIIAGTGQGISANLRARTTSQCPPPCLGSRNMANDQFSSAVT